MSSPTSEKTVKKATWDAYQSALQNVLSEMVPEAATAAASGGGNIPDEELRKAVMDAVSAVLLESNLLEKFIARSIQKLPDEEKAKVVEALNLNDSIQKICQDAFRSMTINHLGPVLQKNVQGNIGKAMSDFTKTEEFKDVLDGRFRMMEQYLRGDVIPKMIDDAMERQK